MSEKMNAGPKDRPFSFCKYSRLVKNGLKSQARVTRRAGIRDVAV